ncbi:MAG: EamA family transporter [Planctomycetes bacterium]|nr:EamA family transporter [Planctomycetota bacterium]
MSRSSLAIALLCLVWGSTWYGIRICLAEQPPLTSAAARFLIAGIATAALVPVLRRREGLPPPRPWLWMASGLTNFAGSYGILYVAEQVVPSGPAAVLWGIFPLLMAASGALFLGERLDRRQVLGTLVAFAGIVTVFGGGLGDLDSGNLGHSLLLLASPFIAATGTTLVKKYGSRTSSLLLNRNGMLFGAGALAAAAWLTEDPASARWTAPGVTALVALALFGTTMSFGIYFWLLRTTPASRLALITYVTPIIAMSLGALTGDGTVDTHAWIGTGLVVLGIVLVVRRR